MIYDDESLNDLAVTVDIAVDLLKPYTNEFDSIVVRGVSGIVVGSPVSLALHKPLVIVRKPGDSTHSDNEIENFDAIGSRYLFLDDFTSLGVTRKSVARQIATEGGPKMPACQYLYESGSFTIFNQHDILRFI